MNINHLFRNYFVTTNPAWYLASAITAETVLSIWLFFRISREPPSAAVRLLLAPRKADIG
jgi:hypothetical protein